MQGAELDEQTKRALSALVVVANRELNDGKTAVEVEQVLVGEGLDRASAAAIVRQLVDMRQRKVQVDAGVAQRERWERSNRHGEAKDNIVLGAVICGIGIVVTAFSYSVAKGGGTYVVAWGAIVFGAIRMFKGIAGLDPAPASEAGAPDGAAMELPLPPRRSEPTLLPPTGLTFKMVLLMAHDQLAGRVTVEALGEFSRRVEQEINGYYFRQQIAAGALSAFVIVKPGRRMRVWVEGVGRELGADDVAWFEARTATWKAPEVQDAIVLAYTYESKGAPGVGAPNTPRAWREAAAAAGKPLEIPEGLIAAVWPE